MSRKSLPGFGAPSASTEAPLEMLLACHGRVEHQCATLQRLLPHVAKHGADLAAQQAATAVMRYFDTAAVDHHADEEVDLFPLLESASDNPGVKGLIEALQADHRELEQRWRALRVALSALARGDAAGWPEADVSGFLKAYRDHIARENSELLPLAERVLSPAALARLGVAMRERRGIPAVR